MSFNHWKKYKLKDVAEVLTGFPFKGNLYEDNGVRVVRGENVTIGELRWDTVKCWNQPFSKFDKYSLQKGDIVIGMDGSRVGKNRAQIKEKDLPLLLAQRVARLRSNKLCNQTYLAYIIKSDLFEKYINSVQTGTSIPHVSQKQIEDFELIIPDLEVQNHVAFVLSILDNKIELNRQLNKTLETIAQYLFKEWFVNFNFPGATDKMQNSELGLIPENWCVGSIDEVGTIITGKTPSIQTPEYFGDYLPFVTPTDFKNYHKLVIDADRGISENGKNAFKNKIVPPNSVLVTCIGSDMGKVVLNKVNCLTNQQINSIIPLRDKITSGYLYYYILGKRSLLRSIASGGSTMPIINKGQFEKIKIIIPPMELLNSFQKIVNSIDGFIENNLYENQTLILVRNELLPKLMKGEVNEII